MYKKSMLKGGKRVLLYGIASARFGLVITTMFAVGVALFTWLPKEAYQPIIHSGEVIDNVLPKKVVEQANNQVTKMLGASSETERAVDKGLLERGLGTTPHLEGVSPVAKIRKTTSSQSASSASTAPAYPIPSANKLAPPANTLPPVAGLTPSLPTYVPSQPPKTGATAPVTDTSPPASQLTPATDTTQPPLASDPSTPLPNLLLSNTPPSDTQSSNTPPHTLPPAGQQQPPSYIPPSSTPPSNTPPAGQQPLSWTTSKHTPPSYDFDSENSYSQMSFRENVGSRNQGQR